MATESNRLNTRILLKYDTYANWTANNPVLLAGEVAIATIEIGIGLGCFILMKTDFNKYKVDYNIEISK